MSAAKCSASECPEPVPSAHEPCCSSHGKPLCCRHYKRFHFVETGPAVCHPVTMHLCGGECEENPTDECVDLARWDAEVTA